MCFSASPSTIHRRRPQTKWALEHVASRVKASDFPIKKMQDSLWFRAWWQACLASATDRVQLPFLGGTIQKARGCHSFGHVSSPIPQRRPGTPAASSSLFHCDFQGRRSVQTEQGGMSAPADLPCRPPCLADGRSDDAVCRSLLRNGHVVGNRVSGA